MSVTEWSTTVSFLFKYSSWHYYHKKRHSYIYMYV